MYALLNKFHIVVDGTPCWGIMQFMNLTPVYQGVIFTYICSQCGCLIQNKESMDLEASPNSFF